MEDSYGQKEYFQNKSIAESLFQTSHLHVLLIIWLNDIGTINQIVAKIFSSN